MRIPALLQEKLENGKVRCLTCQRRCVVFPQRYGFCKTRFNDKGTLYSTTYGLVSSLSNNPIEKKPLFHYYPGSVATTIGSVSCNFACPWCQNWEISKVVGDDQARTARFMTPQQIIDFAVRSRVQGISVSFNEPTLSLEYALELFKLARPDLYCMFVTNGYMTDDALKLLVKAGLTGVSVTLKGPASMVKKFCKADVEGVWATLALARSMGVHVEVVSLVIPGINEDTEFVRLFVKRILTELGSDTPVHFTRYFPAYRFSIPATSIEALEAARDIALETGLHYSYVGNVPGHPYENTFCPTCQNKLIRRHGLSTIENHITDEQTCPNCGEFITLYPPMNSHA